jgi:hypothetical protein
MSACRRGNPDEAARIAEEAVTRFHTAFGQARFAEICQSAEPGALFPENNPGGKMHANGQEFKPWPAASCPEHLTYVHDKLGNVLDAKRLQPPYLVERPAGAIVELEYETHFDRGQASERFDWRVTAGNAKLVGYRMESHALDP